MAISVGTPVYVDDGNFTTNSTTVTLAINTAAGDTIHLWCTVDSGTGVTVSQIADDKNAGTWNAAPAPVDDDNDPTNQQRTMQWRRENVAAGTPTTITVTYTGARGAKGAAAVAISGAASPSLDQHAVNVQQTPGTGTDGVKSTAKTPTLQPGVLVALSFNTGGNGAPAAGTGFTDCGAGWGFGGTTLARIEKKSITSLSSIEATFTAGTNSPHSTLMAIFSEAGAGAGAPLRSLSPTFPDQVRAAPRAVREGMSVGPVAPVAAAPAAPTGFSPAFPDQVRSVPRSVLGGWSTGPVAPVGAAPAAPPGIPAVFPDVTRGPLRPVREGMSVGPVAPVAAPSVPVGWGARFPDRVPGPIRQPQGRIMVEPPLLLPNPAYVPLFPLKVSADGRYLTDQRDMPFRLQVDNIWEGVCHGTPEGIGRYLNCLKSRGFTGTLFQNIVHAGGGAWVEVNEPADLAGHQPFGTPGVFSTRQDPYFDNVKAAIDKAEALGLIVVFFHTYCGFNGGPQGWESELVNNNTNTDCFNWGVYLATKFSNPNILWMHMGDHTISGTALTRFQNVVAGIQSVSRSRLSSSELDNPNTLTTSQTGFTYGPNPATTDMNFDWFYGWGASQNGRTYTTALAAWDDSVATIPAAIGEAIQVGANFSALDTRENVRTQYHWAITSGAIAGGNFGVEGRWDWLTDAAALATFNPGALAGISNDSVGDATQDATYSNAFYQSLPWWTFRPSGTAAGRCGRDLIVSGVGTNDAFISSCMSRNGSHLLAYVPQQSASTTHTFSVDLRGMAGNVRARWWNPTTGGYDDSSGGATSLAYSLANTLSAQSFTSPGSNGQRDDWMLVLDALPTLGLGAVSNPDRIFVRPRLVQDGFSATSPPATIQPPSVPAISQVITAPDRISPVRRPVAEGMSVSEPQLPQLAVPALAWAAEFPDTAPGPKRPVQEGASVSLPSLPAQPPPALAWAAEFADMAPGPRRPVQEGFSAPVPWLATLPVPALAWAAEFADSVPRGKARPVGEGFSASVPWLSSLPIIVSGFDPSFPDLVRGARPNVPVGMMAFSPLPIVNPGAIPGWQNGFPDRIFVLPRNVGEGFSTSVPQLAQLAVPPLGWQGQFPDRAPGPRRPVPEGFSALNPLPLGTFPILSWAGSFPDRAVGPRRPVQEGWSVSEPFLSSLPVPGLGWMPRFPDFALGPRRPVGEGMSVANVLPIAPVIVPALSWAPVFPDIARGARRPVQEGWSVSVPQLLSLPPPPLAGQPSFPDRVWAQARPVPEGFSAGVPWVTALPVPGMGWTPSFPNEARGPRRPVNEGGAFGLPQVSALPVPLLSWTPSFPDWIAVAQRCVQLGLSVIAPFPIANPPAVLVRRLASVTIGLGAARIKQPIAWPLVQDGALELTILDSAGDPIDLTGVTIEIGIGRAGSAPLLQRAAAVTGPGTVRWSFTQADWSGFFANFDYLYDIQLTDAGGKRTQVVPVSTWRPLYFRP
jgi:hypothetical protein